MVTGDAGDPPRIRSWITPKAAKGGPSGIAGRGVHAIEPIAGGDVVAVKGGHIVASSVAANLPGDIRKSAFPISMRDIAAGEELTIDYALFLGDPGFTMDCRCGAAACRGTVRGTDWMLPELQERYRGWFSWWLR
jgi:hypothetical protein